jgi:glycerol uptake facilitator-like aquaporin
MPVTSAPVLWRRLAAEFLGSAFLAAIVIGSGIAALRLSPGNTGLQLLYNSAATAAGLFAIILMFGPVSGAHFNPVVSFADAALGGMSWKDAAAYLPAQVAGCVAGAVTANVMFGLAAVSISTKHRASGPHALSEVIATAGLILVILFSDTFAGIAPSSVPVFIVAEIGGGVAAVLLISKVLYPALTPAQAAGAVVPHEAGDGLAGQDGDPRRVPRRTAG